MKNLHIIATDKPSRLYLEYGDGDLCLANQLLPQTNRSNNQHIYITNDEEIKEGDWVIEFQKGDNIGEVHFINGEYVIANDIQKKIIITTDIDLIKDGVQAIDDEFLKWLVNNPSCEEVETIIVSTWCNDGKVCVCNVPKFCNEKRNDFKYKIIIPKEEQKELRRKLFTLIKSLEQEEPKKETIEEAAERFLNGEYLIPTSSKDKVITKQMLIDGANNYFGWGFLEGAKWQAERMYSEIGVKESLENEALKWWMSLTMDEQVEIGLKYNEPTFNLTLRAIIHEFSQFKKK